MAIALTDNFKAFAGMISDLNTEPMMPIILGD